GQQVDTRHPGRSAMRSNFKTQLPFVAAVLILLGAGPAAAKDYVYGSCVPATDYLTSDALPLMFERIAKDTNGEIKWKSIAGAQIADCKASFTAVQDRLMEAGLAIPTYVP